MLSALTVLVSGILFAQANNDLGFVSQTSPPSGNSLQAIPDTTEGRETCAGQSSSIRVTFADDVTEAAVGNDTNLDSTTGGEPALMQAITGRDNQHA